MSIVLPAKRDAIIVEGDETMVGDGNAVRVTSQRVEDMFWPTERRLSVHDPVLMEELLEETMEAVPLREAHQRAMELEPALIKEHLKAGSELAAKDAAQNTDRQ